jgi:transposase
MAKRRNFSTDFKAKVALASIRNGVTMGDLASRYDIHQNTIAKWKRQALAGMKEGFGCNAPNRDGCREAEINTLQA